MKPIPPAYIALGATIPVALFVVWWIYRKQPKDVSSEQNTLHETSQSFTNISDEVPVLQSHEESDQEILLSSFPDPTRRISLDEIQGKIEDVIDEDDLIRENKQDADSQPLDNNNEDISIHQLANSKIIVVTEPCFSEEQDIHTDTLDGESTAAFTTVSDKTNDESSTMCSPTDLSLIKNPPGGGDAPINLSHHFDVNGFYKEEDHSLDQYSEESSMLGNDDTRNLLDIAITNSVQTYMSLPIIEVEPPLTEISHEESSHPPNVPSLGPEDAASMSSPTDISTYEDESQKVGEEELINFEENKELETEESPVSSITTEQIPEGSLEESKDCYTPSSLSSAESQNEDDTYITKDSPETSLDKNVELSEKAENRIEENGDLEKEERTNEQGLSVTNSNNNNNSENSDKNQSTQSATSENIENGDSANVQEDNAASNMNGQENSMNGEVHEDDAKRKVDDFCLNHNSTDVVDHKPPLHNGPTTDEHNQETQVYLEFPSSKVGLLIGKLGRNIKLLKQESGAEIMVHTVPFREDIQVLQIVGTSTSVQSAASKIQSRFREVNLTEFDAANVMGLHSPTAIISPAESPISQPTFAYPIPDMSQLRLPEGVAVEVIVSAIADCDSVFLQQYTHPTFHSLASLEQAMSLCYTAGSTPPLLSPVQVGLVCVAEHQDIWYRAQVIHASEDSSEVTIKFVDYGGYSTIPTSTVKQIRADFITLPFQASECYLDNIAPLEGETNYSPDSTKVLQDLLKEGEFHARISRYRSDGHPLICLYKRHDNTTEVINELLVTKGVARNLDPDEYTSNTSAA